jgi:hypothetical protein
MHIQWAEGIEEYVALRKGNHDTSGLKLTPAGARNAAANSNPEVSIFFYSLTIQIS